MSYAEKITAYEAKRVSLAAGLQTIMESADAEGTTVDAEQDEQFEELKGQIEAIDKQLARYRDLENLAAKAAVPAAGKTSDEGSQSRGGEAIIVKTQPKLEPGMEFARLMKAYGEAKGNMDLAARIAQNRYGPDSNAYGALKRIAERGQQRLQWDGYEKANVLAGSTASGNWASDLVLDEGGSFADMVEYARAATIVGKFGTGNIPSLRRIPFRTALGISTSGGAGYWVGEGLAKPLTSFNVNKTFLEPLKCANIVVLTEELLMSSASSAETLVRDEMRNALVELIDVSFIDPNNSGSANVEPASITNGADAIVASSGGDADDIRLDLRSLVQKFVNANTEGESVVLIMRTGDALAASMLTNALGQTEFPNVGMGGGNLIGLPVITSQNVPSGVIVAVQPSNIYFADEGGFMVDVSREASLLMTDDANANHNSVTPTPSQVVSMWQTNSVAFRCERILNWARRRSTAVAYITSAAWGGAVNT
jgi:hypothetical protein